MFTWRAALVLSGVLAISVAFPATVSAQWYFAGYFGANQTRPADVHIDVPSADLVVTFSDVRFTAEPFRSPPYYGWRVGRDIGERRRFGIELEFIHLKVIADTGRDYVTHGRLTSIGPDGRSRMDTLVQRYSMTHGLNFILINGVWRRALTDRLTFVARAGAGGTLPHSESTVLNVSREQYEYAGPAGHAAAGIDVDVVWRLSLSGEYKLTYARPQIAVAGGTGRTTTLSHQVAVGFVLR